MPEKRIYLSALNIEAVIPEEMHFHDDGFVQDLNMHFVMRAASYAVARREVEEVVKNKTIFGRTVLFRHNNQKYIHIACCKNRDNVQNLQTKAHEETHVLQLTGNFEILEELLEKSNLRINFRKIENRAESLEEFNEITANIGGLFACQKRFGYERVLRHYQDNTRQFKFLNPAFNTYRGAVLKTLPLLDSLAVRIFGFGAG